MIERLVDFVRLLRASGLPISPAESADAARAALEVGLDRPEVVRAALRSTLVKQSADGSAFDELFAIFFAGRLADGSALPLAEELERQGLEAGRVEELLERARERLGSVDPLVEQLVGLRQDGLERMFEQARQRMGAEQQGPFESPLGAGLMLQRIYAQMGAWAGEKAARALAVDLGQPLDPEEAQAVRHAVEATIARLFVRLREMVRREQEERLVPVRRRLREDLLREKGFAGANADDLEKIRLEVIRLARRLRGMRRPRRERSRRGALDPHATARRALATDGVPIEIIRARRRRDRPRIVALCDISDSVRQVSRFFLTFAHTLQSEVALVRSFVFVAGMAEVTDLFRQAQVDRAVELAHTGRDALGKPLLEVLVGSDFGRSFSAFADRYLDALTPKSTLLVIGDGRSNYSPPRPEILALMRSRARRLVWLVPEGRPSWGLGDSAMPVYAPICDEIHVVTNLSALARAVDRLLVR